METQQKKVISFDELLSRATASDLAQKLQYHQIIILCYYHFI